MNGEQEVLGAVQAALFERVADGETAALQPRRGDFRRQWVGRLADHPEQALGARHRFSETGTAMEEIGARPALGLGDRGVWALSAEAASD